MDLNINYSYSVAKFILNAIHYKAIVLESINRWELIIIINCESSINRVHGWAPVLLVHNCAHRQTEPLILNNTFGNYIISSVWPIIKYNAHWKQCRAHRNRAYIIVIYIKICIIYHFEWLANCINLRTYYCHKKRVLMKCIGNVWKWLVYWLLYMLIFETINDTDVRYKTIDLYYQIGQTDREKAMASDQIYGALLRCLERCTTLSIYQFYNSITLYSKLTVRPIRP